METVALSSKGRFVLPKTIRDRHHWNAGTEFMVIDRGDSVLLKPVKPFPETSFEPSGMHFMLQILFGYRPFLAVHKLS